MKLGCVVAITLLCSPAFAADDFTVSDADVGIEDLSSKKGRS